MIDLRFVPVQSWPGKPNQEPRPARFRAKYAARLDLLEKELGYLGANDIIIQAHFTHSEIRNDGWPRSTARPILPGVIVTFKNHKKEQLSFPCDTYKDWTDNLYAIALSLEALRTVDRYGVTQNEEQYQGWKRLAAPAQEQPKDLQWALAHLARVSGINVGNLNLDPVGSELTFYPNPEAIEKAYREAAKRTHPDSGGNVHAFHLVQEAYKIVKES